MGRRGGDESASSAGPGGATLGGGWGGAAGPLPTRDLGGGLDGPLRRRKGGVTPSEDMTQRRVRAVYMRGGTSRCLVFHEEDLPHPGLARDRILLAALGSPDPYGRQLDGPGGGSSSLSKACIIGPPTPSDPAVNY